MTFAFPCTDFWPGRTIGPRATTSPHWSPGNRSGYTRADATLSSGAVMIEVAAGIILAFLVLGAIRWAFDLDEGCGCGCLVVVLVLLALYFR